MQETGDTGSVRGSRGYPWKRKGNPPQYFCPENSMDRGVWRATVYGVVKSQTQLSIYTQFSIIPENMGILILSSDWASS